MQKVLVVPHLFLVAVVVAACLLHVGQACDGHDHDHYNKVVEVKGRRRTLLSMTHRKCGSVAPTEEEIMRLANAERKEAAKLPSPAANVTRNYTIDTYVTVVMANDGSKAGDAPDSQIKAQIAMMNAAYGVSASAHGVRWSFRLVRIKRVSGPSMCDKAAEEQLKAMHRQGGPDALNLYFTDLGDCGLLGYSTWPWQLRESKDSKVLDGVVIHYDTLPGGKEAPYNMGRTCVHEVGHWMGLFHTFQNGCTRGGDLVPDTPFAAGPTQGCPNYRDSCSEPGADPIHNYMDYSDDNCMHSFTAKQHDRMESQFRLYRS